MLFKKVTILKLWLVTLFLFTSRIFIEKGGASDKGAEPPPTPQPKTILERANQKAFIYLFFYSETSVQMKSQQLCDIAYLGNNLNHFYVPCRNWSEVPHNHFYVTCRNRPKVWPHLKYRLANLTSPSEMVLSIPSKPLI